MNTWLGFGTCTWKIESKNHFLNVVLYLLGRKSNKNKDIPCHNRNSGLTEKEKGHLRRGVINEDPSFE